MTWALNESYALETSTMESKYILYMSVGRKCKVYI